MHVGNFYQHPEDGLIYVTKGAFEVDGRISNHFYWICVDTMEVNCGYGGDWPAVEGWRIAGFEQGPREYGR